MLGADLLAACRRHGYTVTGLDLPELDITDYASANANVNGADVVVNCAAYTRVDDAEKERDLAYDVNAKGACNVASVCAKRGLRLIHISTDYVFDGLKRRPYAEEDSPNPLNVYGASKLAGEKAVRAECSDYVVVRTQSLFGLHGRNFVGSIVRKLSLPDPIRVVNDQVSSPTNTVHLADALCRLMAIDVTGVVNVSAAGYCSWYEFACAIAARLRKKHDIQPIPADQLALPAVRPAFSVLDNRKYRAWTGRTLPSWDEGLAEYLASEGYTGTVGVSPSP